MLCVKVLEFMCSKGVHDIFSAEQRIQIVQKLWRYDGESSGPALADPDEENKRLRRTIRLLAEFLSLRSQAESKPSRHGDSFGADLSTGNPRKLSSTSTGSVSSESSTEVGEFFGLPEDVLLALGEPDESAVVGSLSPDADVPLFGSAFIDSFPTAEDMNTASVASPETEGCHSALPSPLTPPAIDACAAPLHVPALAPRDVEEVLLGASLQTNNQSMSGASDDPLLSLSAFALTPPAEKAHASWEGFCSSDEEASVADNEPLARQQEECNSRKEEAKDDKSKEGQPITLSEFLLECLHFDCYDHIIRWRNRKEGTFKIVESQVLAMMWGMVKRKPDMNFDKMSRAMRYYYSKGILEKSVNAARLEYTFGKNTAWQSFKPSKSAVAGRFFFPPQSAPTTLGVLPAPLKAYQRLMRMRCSKSFKSARFLPYLIPPFAEVV